MNSPLHSLALGSAAGTTLHSSLSHHMHLPTSLSQQTRHTHASSTAAHNNAVSALSTAPTSVSSSAISSVAGLNSNLYAPVQNNTSSYAAHPSSNISKYEHLPYSAVSKYEHLLSSSNAVNNSNSVSSLGNGLSSSTPSPNYHHSSVHLHHHHHATAAAHHAAHHSAAALGHHASVGGGNSYGVKSESSAANYDYVNNCYFGGSFGALGASSASVGMHGTASELAGYHHQHNVIQAAKLMATS